MAQTEQLGEIGGWEWGIAADAYYWTPEAFRIFGVAPASHTPDFTAALARFTPASATILRSAIQRGLDHGQSFDLKLQLNSLPDKRQDKVIWVRIAGRTEAADGKTVRIYLPQATPPPQERRSSTATVRGGTEQFFWWGMTPGRARVIAWRWRPKAIVYWTWQAGARPLPFVKVVWGKST
jgi:hypothetical protein